MNEEFNLQDDPLRPVLREWEAPEPAAELDARVRAAFRAQAPLPLWKRIWTARVSLPVPVFAALLLLAAALFFTFRPTPPAAPVETDRYVTRVNTVGFQPLPNGEARVVKVEESKQ